MERNQKLKNVISNECIIEGSLERIYEKVKKSVKIEKCDLGVESPLADDFGLKHDMLPLLAFGGHDRFSHRRI